MRGTQVLMELSKRIDAPEKIQSDPQLPPPPDWRADGILWARVIGQARLYGKCHARPFTYPGIEEVVARLFDHLAGVAEQIRRGSSLGSIQHWINTPGVRETEDARYLRKLVALMNFLEVF